MATAERAGVIQPNPAIDAMLKKAKTPPTVAAGETAPPFVGFGPKATIGIFYMTGLDMTAEVTAGDPQGFVKKLQGIHPFDTRDAQLLVEAAYGMIGQPYPEWPPEELAAETAPAVRKASPFLQETGEAGKVRILARAPTQWNLMNMAVRKQPELAKTIADTWNHNLALICGGTVTIEGDEIYTDGVIWAIGKNLAPLQQIEKVALEGGKLNTQIEAAKKNVKGVALAYMPLFDAMLKIDAALHLQPPDIENILPSDLTRLLLPANATQEQIQQALDNAKQLHANPVQGNFTLYEKGMKELWTKWQTGRREYVKLAKQIQQSRNLTYNPTDATFNTWLQTEIQKQRPTIVLITQINDYFRKAPAPTAEELGQLIQKVLALGGNPTAANPIIETQINPKIQMPYLATATHAPKELQQATAAIRAGTTGRLPPEQKFLVDIVNLLNGTGIVEGTILTAEQRVNMDARRAEASTRVVDDINNLYGYLDGGRVYPVTLYANQSLIALRQWVHGLLTDPRLSADLAEFNVTQALQIPDIPINSFKFDTDKQATVNITAKQVKVKQFGGLPMDIPIDLVINDTETGITIDLKDPNMKQQVQSDPELKTVYTLINQLPTLLRKHMNRRLQYKDVTGFHVNKGFQISGGPKGITVRL